MLDLADPRWSQLETHSSDASWLPEWLRRLSADPDNVNLFYGLWSDENTWSAAFSAAPQQVAIARVADVHPRVDKFSAQGTFAAYPPDGRNIW
jgi:hypothetical protein